MSEEKSVDRQPADKAGNQSAGNSQSTVGSGQSAVGTTGEAANNEQSAEALAKADKQQTINMETHAHHLHKAPGKKWTHFFFAFFMLILAVFAGFLAENLSR